MTQPITTAMVLAAGLGTRMRPITDTLPKPLVRVGGKTLLDWTLDEFAAAGITKTIINVHHLASQIRGHVSVRTAPQIVISDETDQLLETGGGIVKAVPLLGTTPFLAANTDAFTVNSSMSAVARLQNAWNDSIDALLLLHPIERTHGFDGAGDFAMDSASRPIPRGSAPRAPFVYAGIQLLRPEIFKDEKPEPFSMWRIWQKLMATGRLAGVVQDGEWFHVGTPEAITATDLELNRMGLGAGTVSSHA
jgi:MurNAc alpha-1-phosphate uridylyltransferase